MGPSFSEWRAGVAWHLSALLLCAASATVGHPACAQAAAADSRPTVAVMYFDNGALVQHADYDPFSKGIADMLITSLATNDKVRVVERDQLQQLLKEQALATTQHIDAATAARVGKLLGARHMIFGGFIIDKGGNMRLDARAVNTETSEIEHVESVADKADNMLAMVSQLADKLNTGLKLPALSPAARAAPAARPASDSGVPAAAPGKPVRRWQALLVYSRALVEEDNGHPAQAAALYTQFLSETPTTFATAQRSQAEQKLRKLRASTEN